MSVALAVPYSKKIIQLSDLHFTPDATVQKGGRSPQRALNAVLHAIKPQIDEKTVIVITGDLVFANEPNLYCQLAQLFCTMPCPVYAIPGNHDAADMLHTHFIAENIEHQRRLSFANWRVLLLDTSEPGSRLGSGRLTQRQLSQLNTDLAEAADLDVAIFLHHPPLAFGAQWMQHINLENSDEFNQLTDSFENIRLLAFGHAHIGWTLLRQQRLYASAPSTWVQVDHTQVSAPAYLTAPPGYNLYYFYPNGQVSCQTQAVQMNIN